MLYHRLRTSGFTTHHLTLSTRTFGASAAELRHGDVIRLSYMNIADHESRRVTGVNGLLMEAASSPVLTSQVKSFGGVDSGDWSSGLCSCLNDCRSCRLPHLGLLYIPYLAF